MLGSKPASGAGTKTWALFGDTALTAVQASPSSFHKQDRSGRNCTALVDTKSEKRSALDALEFKMNKPKEHGVTTINSGLVGAPEVATTKPEKKKHADQLIVSFK